MSERSYEPAREGRGLDGELARLEAQVALSWAEERRLLERLGWRNHMRVLEVGCGPGLVSRRLLDAWPATELTALDHDPALLSRARAALGGATGHVRFLEGAADALPCADGQFDAVLARYVFQHLPNPVAAAREAWRVLRPGGSVVVIDVDAALWGVAEPAFPEVVPIFVKTGRAHAARGGNRLIGRTLHRLLHEAGFADARLDVFAYHSDAMGLDAFEPQLSADRLLPLVDRGLITSVELDIVRRAHASFRQSPTAFVMMLGFAGSATKHTEPRVEH